MTRADGYVSVDEYQALGADFHRCRDQLDAAHRLIAQLQAELARWQTNCTGRHGSQMVCGSSLDLAQQYRDQCGG